MPVHDWSRVIAGVFHDFHQAWIVALSNALNAGVLADDYYAMIELAAGSRSDVLTRDEAEDSDGWRDRDVADGGVAVAERPPKVRYTLEAEAAIYAAKADRIALYHTSGDRVVAFLEIVSPGNKRSQVAVRQLLDKLAGALEQGRHLLVIDLHPPGRHDPDGLHAALWGSTPGVTSEQPLSLAAYRADTCPTAYFEPIATGDVLPDMPLFLTPDRYVNVPLETTYQTAWRGVPQRWKRVIVGESA
jgi:hypothetical protein